MIDNFEFKDKYNVYDLVNIVRCLRAEGGCPWDIEQTHESIKKNLIEETYETIEAINKKSVPMLREELGDVLMQVIFHSQIEAENGNFDIDDVADENAKKLIERHPHVFGSVEVSGVDDVLTNWDAIKRRTKKQKTTTDSIMSIPRELPALMRADKIQSKASKVGFDWQSADGAVEKLYEEADELKEAIRSGDKENIFAELGDLLFSAVNISRFVDCDAEEALTAASDKFSARFAYVEKIAAERNIDMKNTSLSELDRLWDEAKLKEKEEK